ncbi:unnamed protein product [Knipowitschia caucasica]
MSCHCKLLVSLLQRSVRIAQTAFPTVIKAQIGGRGSYQHRLLSSVARDVTNKHIFATQTIPKSSTHHFCTKPRSPVEDEYPPLPDYDRSEEDLQKKEVFIVHVKGLPWSCTPKDLLQFFSDCRIRDGEKGIHMTADRSGRPSGRAFIEVEHEEDLSKALEKHRQYMGPRYVEVYEVTNSDAEAIIKNTAEGGSSDCVVRIRGLPYSSSKADIAHFFSGLDIVQNGVTIVADHKGRNSGEAFIEFTSQEDFEEALSKNRELIGNRYIEVFPSRKDEIRTGPRNRSNVNPPQAQRRTPPTASNSQRHDVRNAHSSPVSSHHVHMRGLPFSASAEDIVEFFSPLAVSKLQLEFGPNGRPSGEADVFFSCHQDAVEAMSRDRMHIGERYIELFLNSETDR